MTRKKTESIDFEKSLTELNSIVENLEKGNLPLENSLKMFERGIVLSRQCQKALQQAEQKVQILLKQNNQTSLEDFQPDEE